MALLLSQDKTVLSKILNWVRQDFAGSRFSFSCRFYAKDGVEHTFYLGNMLVWVINCVSLR